jgi:DNA repair protein RecO (recombination protein O)
MGTRVRFRQRRDYTGHVSRTLKTEAVVLRSLRYGEADRILQLFTKERGRIGAIAKGVRRTRSRFGARLEPFSHVDLLLHEGRGELATVTGADLIRSHHALAADPYRVAAGSIGLEAVLRLFIEHDENRHAFNALVRFLDLLDEPMSSPAAAPAIDVLTLSFQLKLLWLAGYLPHLTSCASCENAGPLVAFSAAAGGAVCSDCAADATPISAAGFLGLRSLLEQPLSGARATKLTPGAARETLRVIESVYEYHGGFRMRTLARR